MVCLNIHPKPFEQILDSLVSGRLAPTLPLRAAERSVAAARRR
jgi:hypothetical protein